MRHELQLQHGDLLLRTLAPGDATELAALVDPQLWAGMTSTLPGTPELMGQFIEAATADPSRMPFAVVDLTGGSLLGSTSLYDLAPSQRRIGIGTTFYGRASWGSRVNPTCKLLLLSYCFDELDVNRVELRCDVRNSRSANAIERLGATREGTLRAHRIAADGSVSDTATFSIIAAEWPQVRAGLLHRVEPSAGVDGPLSPVNSAEHEVLPSLG